MRPVADDAAAPRGRQARAWAFPSISPVKDAEVVVVGDHLGCPAFKRALHCALRALVDRLGARTFNAALLNIDLGAPPPEDGTLLASARAAGASAWLARARGDGAGGASGGGGGAPVVARVVGRGKLGSAASDYGCLEVFGGASIGATDPYVVAAALDAQLAEVPAVPEGRS